MCVLDLPCPYDTAHIKRCGAAGTQQGNKELTCPAYGREWSLDVRRNGCHTVRRIEHSAKLITDSLPVLPRLHHSLRLLMLRVSPATHFVGAPGLPPLASELAVPAAGGLTALDILGMLQPRTAPSVHKAGSRDTPAMLRSGKVPPCPRGPQSTLYFAECSRRFPNGLAPGTAFSS